MTVLAEIQEADIGGETVLGLRAIETRTPSNSSLRLEISLELVNWKQLEEAMIQRLKDKLHMRPSKVPEQSQQTP